jgi:hypothetical protein
MDDDVRLQSGPYSMCEIGDAVALAALFALFGKDLRELAFKACHKAHQLATELCPADVRWALKRAAPDTVLIRSLLTAVACLLDAIKYRVGSELLRRLPPLLQRSHSLRDAVQLGLWAGLMYLGYVAQGGPGSFIAFFVGLLLISCVDDYAMLRSYGLSGDANHDAAVA